MHRKYTTDLLFSLPKSSFGEHAFMVYAFVEMFEMEIVQKMGEELHTPDTQRFVRASTIFVSGASILQSSSGSMHVTTSGAIRLVPPGRIGSLLPQKQTVDSHKSLQYRSCLLEFRGKRCIRPIGLGGFAGLDAILF